VGRVAGGGRRQRRADRVGQPLQHVEVAGSGERLEHGRAGRRPLPFQRHEQHPARVLLVGREARDLPVQPEPQHVQVAHRAERAAQPAQLRPQVVRPGGVQQRPRGLQRGPHPPHGDPHLVEVLDVLAGAGAGLVREQGAQALVE
jgi:hypothetical protein